MTGFKTGPTDLYDEDEGKDSTDAANEESVDATAENTPMTETESQPDASDTSTAAESDGMPFIPKRRAAGEEMTWQRKRVVFYLREQFKTQENVLKTDAEVHLGEDISKFDLREAMYQVALENPELVYETLEEMGVGYDFQ